MSMLSEHSEPVLVALVPELPRLLAATVAQAATDRAAVAQGR